MTKRSTPRRLDADDRAFLARVSDAAFANPFGGRRDVLDAAIAETSASDPGVVPKMLARVEAKLHALAPKGRVHLDAFTREDAELVEDALLLLVFHRHREAFDRHVESELRATEPGRADFAIEAVRELVAFGVGAARARRAVEMFYQMHRAHVFIARGLVGGSRSMRTLREGVWSSLFTRDVRRYERHLWDRMEDFSTLLLGETGTGKGAVASALGRSGYIELDESKRRFARRIEDGFTSLSLGELPESLLESSLFGHRKGSFTGAVDHYDGVLARCRSRGTVFLDEIADAPVHVQSKLLRVLQERSFVPIGATESKRFDGRVIAATSQPMDELVARGAFRIDLYYRLAANVLVMPTLRSRIAEDRAELGSLVAHACERITGHADDALADEVRASLEAELGREHPFPGNVRELEQCVRRVLLTGSVGRALAPARRDDDPTLRAFAEGTLSAEALLDAYCARLFATHASYVEVARITGLDRRTVKARVDRARASS